MGSELRIAIPETIPRAYLDFTEQPNTTDIVLTLNYDLVMERALEQVGLPYRRFPDRYSEINEGYAVVDQDQPDELVLTNCGAQLIGHTSLERDTGSELRLTPLVESPRPGGDPLGRIAVIPRDRLDRYLLRSTELVRTSRVDHEYIHSETTGHIASDSALGRSRKDRLDARVGL